MALTVKTCQLETHENHTAYRPGDTILGLANWSCDEPPEAVEVRLFWRTEGKGTTNAEVVDTIRFDRPPAVESQIFEFKAPPGPHSYDGSMLGIVWSLEMIIKPGDHTDRLDITIGPEGQELTPSGSNAATESH